MPAVTECDSREVGCRKTQHVLGRRRNHRRPRVSCVVFVCAHLLRNVCIGRLAFVSEDVWLFDGYAPLKTLAHGRGGHNIDGGNGGDITVGRLCAVRAGWFM